MSESEQPTSPSFNRPTVQPMPMQRGNYGVPPRQTVQATTATPVPTLAPQPAQSPRPASISPMPVSGPRMMDVSAPPRPQAPTAQSPATPVAPAPVTAMPATQSQPVIPATPMVHVPVTQPLFAARPTANQPAAAPKKASKLRGKWRIMVFVAAGLLCIAGMARWATAGSTAGSIIAVAAVKSNDGTNMTIQFTANDGQLHKFTTKSNPEFIPGTALQVAYRAGAPEATVKQVAIVQSARDLGIRLFLIGIVLFMVGGIILLVQKLRGKKAVAPLTTPVTV